MPVTMTDAIKEAWEYAPGDITYWDTLEFNHTSFAAAIKIVNSFKTLVTNQGSFLPVSFDCALPEESTGVRGEMVIRINNVPLSYRLQIREIASSRTKMTITYRQYIAESSDPDAELPITLQTVGVSETDTGLEVRASLSGLISAKFPKRIMLTQDLPGAIV